MLAVEHRVDHSVRKLLNSWHDNVNSDATSHPYLEHTKSWVESKNEGGLFLVNHEFYLFIRQIENIARTILNQQFFKCYKGQDLRDVLMKKFGESSLLESRWVALTRKLENEQLANTLKQIILRKWIGLRARAFANAWVEAAKKKAKVLISRKSEPSLRKTLHSSKKKAADTS